jgi:7,8-dihydropterin-6-yl-methyl-4-(beta-D-ribofuranosyl)aminobenzene 5'-phosphate synthase
MKITIIYDNTVCHPDLIPDWGFACLVETGNHTLLFDTGARGRLLLNNMKTLGISPQAIDMVFLSHDHFDHTGGLQDFLSVQPTKVVAPAGCRVPPTATDVIGINQPMQIGDGLYSTGALDDFEQSLVIRQDDRMVVVVGCSHPGVGRILEAASGFGRVNTLVGGLHGFNDFPLIETLDGVCPTHCTQHITEIKQRFPEKYLAGGAGTVLQL